MYDLQRLRDECIEFCDEADIILTVPVVINKRLSTTLGQVRFTKNTLTDKCEPERIEFSQEMLNDCDDATIRAVLEHECCHYITMIETGTDHGHDKVFKETCRRMGCDNDTIEMIVNYTHEMPPERYKYDVWCDTCERVVYNYQRMNRILRDIENCRCGYCRQKTLSYIQNW